MDIHALVAWVAERMSIPIAAGYAMSVLLVHVGTVNLVRSARLRLRGVRVPGVVSGPLARSAGNPVAVSFTFTTREGGRVLARQRFSTSPNLLRLGQRVTVVYDPRAPERAEVAGAVGQVVAPVLFLCAGVVFGALATLFLVAGPM
ncbi:DUF3592 domain-containing protein [Nocardiopsis tropica]|uniref:DUF3592 domain-containing protein n=1 Tax=Nocardiopsis tropica TaxID=109330 RepID=UPI002E830C0F|nr:DUF3592 domain-containing protein [Nocardiopsis tropica]